MSINYDAPNQGMMQIGYPAYVGWACLLLAFIIIFLWIILNKKQREENNDETKLLH